MTNISWFGVFLVLISLILHVKVNWRSTTAVLVKYLFNVFGGSGGVFVYSSDIA